MVTGTQVINVRVAERGVSKHEHRCSQFETACDCPRTANGTLGLCAGNGGAVAEGRNVIRMKVLAGVATAAMLLPSAARPQEKYPERPIRLLSPFAPGASTDAAARRFAI